MVAAPRRLRVLVGPAPRAVERGTKKDRLLDRHRLVPVGVDEDEGGLAERRHPPQEAQRRLHLPLSLVVVPRPREQREVGGLGVGDELEVLVPALQPAVEAEGVDPLRRLGQRPPEGSEDRRVVHPLRERRPLGVEPQNWIHDLAT
jgi:hypothetical protein